MTMRRLFLTAALVALPALVAAQPTQKLFSLNKSGDITANGGSVEMLNTGGLGTLRVQSTGTYTGTWEVQCSAAPAGATPVYDTDDEVNLSLEGASASPVQAVTDAVAIYKADIAGCTAVRVISTSAMTGTLTVYLSAISTGGSSGGGGSSAAGTVDPTTATAWGIRAEDSAHTTADPGVAVLTKRTDAAATSAGTDGDYATLNTDGSGRLWVNCGTGCSGGTQFAEDVAHTTGDVGTVAMGVRSDTPASLSGTTGDYNPFLTDALGKLWTTGSFAEDAAHTSTDTGNFVLAIRRDTTPSSSSGTAGDYSAFNVDANGRLYTNTTLYDAAGAALTPATDKAEDAAHSSGDTGPVVLGKRTDAAASSAGTDGDYATLNQDANGLQWTRQLSPCTALPTTTVPISVAADTAVISASASNRNYICGGMLFANAAEVLSVWEGTGTACGTSSAAVIGSTTEANGVNLIASQGFSIPTPIRGLSTNVDTCIRIVGTSRITGWLSVAQAP